ncbi:hypothetical protein [Kineosporia mesophila]|uniref:hypothetical protein n=1 Tax=Kineosporia mesophila TaxID=566012 RepID=UPI001E52A2DC|nr:hypothetical protein [Kineosporia mesophila]MCD5354243.1 hypothetical protein [Kineosporia mesophila]
MGSILALENGLRMGSTIISRFSAQWTANFSDLQLMFVDLIMEAHSSVTPEPEASQRPWKTVVALMGGGTASVVPGDWQRLLRIAAGLHGVKLDIRLSPDAAKRLVVRQLRGSPPDGLLVWANEVRDPSAFIEPYLTARPGSYAEVLGMKNSVEPFPDYVAELLLHVEKISGVGRERAAQTKMTWALAAKRIESLEAPHFILTPRAKKSFPGNPYPDARRMLGFIEKLEQLAQLYSTSEGNLGQRLEDAAASRAQIEISLFDSSLTPPTIELDGNTYSAVPHVKVDDFKSPDKCGRIYFAIDSSRNRFIVDHIGLHDYG